MLKLRIETSDKWVEAVLGDFDAFLLDHAACERKASAMAMTFVVRYPDRDAILEPMIQLAREELAHFHRVFRWIQARGLCFQKDSKDPYMKSLLPYIQGGRDAEFIDRLIMAGVVEARGHERFSKIAEALEEGDLKAFYQDIAQSEARHADLFVELARIYAPEEEIVERVDFWLAKDAEAIASIPPRPALH